MRPCPRCGSACPDDAGLCPACGLSLAPTGLARTFVGHRSPDPSGSEPEPPPHAPSNFHGTMAGIAPLTPAGGPPDVAPPNFGTTMNLPGSGPPTPPLSPPQQTTPAPSQLKSTMLGFGPITPPTAPQTPQQNPPFSQTVSMNPGVPKGTMIGMAPLDLPPPPPAATPHGPPGGQGAPHAGPLGSKRTIMGVALPGIAPLHPGQDQPAAPAPAPAADWAPLPSPPPPPDPTELAPEPLPTKGKRRIPILAALAIVAAAALFTAAGVVLLLYRARGEIQTSVALGADGREELMLNCEGCDDRAVVRYESASATFANHRATLRLARELSVGNNQLALVLERRPGKTETIELSVPIEFRVRGDTGDLTKSPPVVKIVARAVPGSAVVIDGKATPLTSDGVATLAIDVSRSLTGPDATQRTLEQRVPYAVTPPGGSPKRGEVSVRIGITPLVLQAPGESIVIDSATFVLAGRTARNGGVSVEGRPITVDASGQFAQVMGVSAEGETTVVVRAAAPDQAPRLIPIRVRRVASLAAETERVRPQATTSYAAIAAPTDAQRGTLVLFDGTVLEARVENFTTVFLMETKSGCSAPPCRLRVTWGSKGSFIEGDPVSVFGTLAGAVDGPRSGTRIPSISASFVAKRRP